MINRKYDPSYFSHKMFIRKLNQFVVGIFFINILKIQSVDYKIPDLKTISFIEI